MDNFIFWCVYLMGFVALIASPIASVQLGLMSGHTVLKILVVIVFVDSLLIVVVCTASLLGFV
tara:strand:- start:421 stop:609 length:189 start_codon:yes stop_codon:yes gene_type:complete